MPAVSQWVGYWYFGWLDFCHFRVYFRFQPFKSQYCSLSWGSLKIVPQYFLTLSGRRYHLQNRLSFRYPGDQVLIREKAWSELRASTLVLEIGSAEGNTGKLENQFGPLQLSRHELMCTGAKQFHHSHAWKHSQTFFKAILPASKAAPHRTAELRVL